MRADFPATDPALDGMHTVVDAGGVPRIRALGVADVARAGPGG